jgi:transposase-like protein
MDRQRTADGRRRWRQWGEQEARDALSELARSGEGIARFARRKGISEQRLYYWRKRIGQTHAPAFVSVPLPASIPQVEIATEAVTVRVREDLDLEHLADLIEVVARRGRGC